MELKRVVVTGLGALTPIGNTKDEYWEALISGKSGAAPITYFDTEKFKTKFACELKNFNATDFLDRKEARKMDKFAQYAMVASDEAIVDAKLNLDSIDKLRVGVIWGAGIGGLETFQQEVLNFSDGDGTPRFNPFFIPKMIADIAAGHISINHGFRGPNFATVSACGASGVAGGSLLLIPVACGLFGISSDISMHTNKNQYDKNSNRLSDLSTYQSSPQRYLTADSSPINHTELQSQQTNFIHQKQFPSDTFSNHYQVEKFIQ